MKVAKFLEKSFVPLEFSLVIEFHYNSLDWYICFTLRCKCGRQAETVLRRKGGKFYVSVEQPAWVVRISLLLLYVNHFEVYVAELQSTLEQLLLYLSEILFRDLTLLSLFTQLIYVNKSAWERLCKYVKPCVYRLLGASFLWLCCRDCLFWKLKL